MKKMKSGAKEGKAGDSPSQLIDARIAALSDWRGATLASAPDRAVKPQRAEAFLF